MPIFRAAGEKGTQREIVAFGFVDVNDGEIALAGGRDIETEPWILDGRTELNALKEYCEGRAEVLLDFGFALGLSGGVELAETLEDLVGFDVDAFDFVIAAAAFDDGPIHNVIGGCAQRIAHIGLFED